MRDRLIWTSDYRNGLLMLRWRRIPWWTRLWRGLFGPPRVSSWLAYLYFIQLEDPAYSHPVQFQIEPHHMVARSSGVEKVVFIWLNALWEEGERRCHVIC